MDENGDLIVPPYLMPRSEKFEGLINYLITKIVKQKNPGTSLVQVTGVTSTIKMSNLTKDVKNDIETVFEEMGLFGADYKFYRFNSIPISAGLNYTYPANENVALFGNAGITLNSLMISDFVIEGSGIKVTSEYDLANSMGIKIGGGVLINKNISIALDYLGLGAHSINGKARADGIPSEEIDFEQKVNLLTLTLGYNF